MEKLKENIEKQIRKEIIFQNLQNNKARAQIALEILLTTGLLEISTILKIKEKILQRTKEIEKKEDLLNNEKTEIIITEY